MKRRAARNPRLPDFLVIGAHKAGTTTIFEHLRAHPEVFVPAVKELHFFSDHNWDNGLDWYRRHFAEAGDRVAGEISPGYSWWPQFAEVPERIRSVLPEVRLVYVLRHPVDRLVSHYRHDVHAGVQTRPIEEVITDWRTYVSRSQYALQIRRYLDAGFAPEQLHVLQTETLAAEPERTMAGIYEFIGVDSGFVPPAAGTRFNRGEELRTERPFATWLRTSRVGSLRRAVPDRIRRAAWSHLGSTGVSEGLENLSISDEVRQQLASLLAEDLRELRTHLGDDFDCWGLLDD